MIPNQTTVVIPVLNEAGNLERVLRAIPSNVVDDVIVVDGGSTDGTPDLARAEGAAVIVETRRGYGRALATGIQHAPRSTYFAFMDGDGSDSPDNIPSLLAPLQQNRADLVLGTRLAEPGNAAGMPPHQQFGNWLAGWFIRLLYRAPITDLGPFRAVRADLLHQLEMREMTYGWPTEMLVKALRRNARVVEVPVRFHPRRHGRSKISGTIKGTLLAAFYILATTFRYSLGSQPLYHPSTHDKGVK